MTNEGIRVEVVVGPYKSSDDDISWIAPRIIKTVELTKTRKVTSEGWESDCKEIKKVFNRALKEIMHDLRLSETSKV